MFGNISRNAALFEHTMCQCCSAGVTLAVATVGLAFVSIPGSGKATVVESDCDGSFGCCVDDDIKPGGGSTPSAISSARCKRAFLSQSSIGYSSELNLYLR